MDFDIRGNLPNKIEVTFDEFQSEFVTNWDLEGSTRQQIFQVFQFYVEDFEKLISPNFTVWIDGSFVSNVKARPNDIDAVFFIDFEIFEKNLKLIESRFGKYGVKGFYGDLLDIYVCPIYPPNHKNAFFTESDKIRWIYQFSSTKPNRFGQKFSKGFIEIKF